jgi:hypothetical protein
MRLILPFFYSSDGVTGILFNIKDKYTEFDSCSACRGYPDKWYCRSRFQALKKPFVCSGIYTLLMKRPCLSEAEFAVADQVEEPAGIRPKQKARQSIS